MRAEMTYSEWRDHQGLRLDSVGGFDVIECQRCAFKHIVPIPSPEELRQIYRNDYYTKDKPLYLERHKEDLEWWNLVYSERYDAFEELLPTDRRRLLDLGSGPGYFLLHGKQRGWEALGLEPSNRAASYARSLGLEIVEGFFNETIGSHLGRFDVVHMHEVLEHLGDPASVVEWSYQMLYPDGLICVCVPNDYNPFQRVLRDVYQYKPWWVAPPHHINYFDADSLIFLLEKEGFSVVLKESTFPIDIFLLMGDDYVDNDVLGRSCHEKRKRFESSLSKGGGDNLKRLMYRCFADLGIGREIIVIARKNGT